MKHSNPTPGNHPRPWLASGVRLIHQVANLALVQGTRRRMANWRLSAFLLRRSGLGQRLALGVRRLNFLTRRAAHVQSERLHSIRLDGSATWQLVRFATTPLVLAGLAVAVFVGLPALYERLATNRGWMTLPLPPIELQSYSGLMATVGQAAAAMLALFFTAISVVASTSYAKVTTDVRVLVAKDDLNRRYLRLLAHTSAVALIGLGLQALGIPPSSVLAAYVALIAGICLLAFFPLGVRTFALFDPSNVSEYPLRAVVRALRTVTRNGRRWLDPSFQNHANRVAEEQLRLLADLVVFGITENRPRQKVVLDLAGSINRLARFYAAQKSSIPSDSLWFTRRAEFKRWEIASSSMTELALRTGVAPHPDHIPDHGFVEDRCTEMTIQCLQHLFAREAIDDAVNLLLDVSRTAAAYAKLFGQAESMRLVAAGRTVLVNRLKATDPTAEPLKQLQLVDVQCVAALAPILYSAVSLTEDAVEQLVCHETGLLQLNRRRLYSRAHPRCVLKDAEDLFQRLEFEKSVEGLIRTQPWYVRQIIASGYAEAIREVIRGILNTVEHEFVAPASELIQAKRPASAGAWLQRGIEGCQKAKDRLEALEARYAELKGFHVTEAPWLDPGVQEALTKVRASRAQIVRLLARIVPDLCEVPAGTTLPDLLGQTRAWLAEELVSMMERKENDGFGDLFIAYFEASNAVSRHFLEIAQQPGKQDHIRVAMDAMVDLMDVSGLALLFSQLDGTLFGEIVVGGWDVFFERATDRPVVVRAWYEALSSKLTLPSFSSGAMRRHHWNRRLAQALIDRGIDVDRHFGPWDRRRIQPHPSPVIDSIIVSYGHPMEQPHDYFGALYLAKLEDAQGIEMPSAIQNCLDAIERARARQEESNDETTQVEPEQG
jgi:cytochrome c oxidase subunit IV